MYAFYIDPYLLELFKGFSLTFPVDETDIHTFLLEINRGIFHQVFDSFVGRKSDKEPFI
jgi:hypothetical protein